MELLGYWANWVGKSSAATEGATRPPATETAEQVFEAYAPQVYNLAHRMLNRNHADAEDITQEVLLQVVRKLNTFRRESELSTWLHRVTVNAVLAHRRRRARRPERQLDRSLDLLPIAGRRSTPRVPHQQAEEGEMHHLVERAIASLPEIYRDVLVLADIEGLPNAEIGQLLGMSLAGIKSRLHRARLMVRGRLAPHFEELCA
jgi:RNA polymerase sigma-70 factor (ECF subfamily)